MLRLLLNVFIESAQVKKNVKTVQTMQMRNEDTNYASKEVTGMINMHAILV